MKRLLSALTLSMLTASAIAQDSDNEPERWYEVELIVFENLKANPNENEYWPPAIEPVDTLRAIELFTPKPKADTTDELIPTSKTNGAIPGQLGGSFMADANDDPTLSKAGIPTPYALLPPRSYQLHDAYKKLEKSENYQPLVHVAWRQVVPPRETPDIIHIHNDLPLPDDETGAADTTTSDTPEFADNLVLELPIELMFEEDVYPQKLDGTVSIGISRYLHVNSDLVLYKPIEQTEETPVITLPQPPSAEFMPFAVEALGLSKLELDEKEPPADHFRIQGSMRMRSGEVHYLDHPYGGMLILFTRYELPEPEETTDEAGEAL